MADERGAGPSKRRVFFALCPTEAVREALARSTRHAVRASGGRPTRTENLHLTVAFLGWLEEAELQRCLDLPAIEIGPFELTLDRLGYWPRPRILWLGPSAVPAPLMALERALWQELTARGFEREQRLFRPHLTLARRCRPVDDAVKAVQWPVDELTLLESRPESDGSRYHPIGRWPL